jgi:hypothetical protein
MSRGLACGRCRTKVGRGARGAGFQDGSPVLKSVGGSVVRQQRVENCCCATARGAVDICGR